MITFKNQLKLLLVTTIACGSLGITDVFAAKKKAKLTNIRITTHQIKGTAPKGSKITITGIDPTYVTRRTVKTNKSGKFIFKTKENLHRVAFRLKGTHPKFKFKTQKLFSKQFSLWITNKRASLGNEISSEQLKIKHINSEIANKKLEIADLNEKISKLKNNIWELTDPDNDDYNSDYENYEESDLFSSSANAEIVAIWEDSLRDAESDIEDLTESITNHQENLVTTIEKLDALQDSFDYFKQLHDLTR